MADGWVWCCSKRKNTKSIRHGTFFTNSKRSIRQILDLMYFWSQKLDSHHFLRRHCRFASESTIVDWKNFMRDVCGESFLRHPQVIGGVRHVVEIDESAWTKRKYNRGRQVSNQWVFGGIDRDTRECFAVLVDHRDANTLISSNTFVLALRSSATNRRPTTESSIALNNTPISPSTILNTSSILSLIHILKISTTWMCMKMKKKAQMDQHVTLLEIYLIEFMWRRRFGDHPFEALLRAIQEKYPV